MQVDQSSRMPLIDALKAACCLLIVTHHLSIYGPMSDIAYPLIPVLIDWLREHGRLAVQIFFVIAGYLSAAKLAPQGLSQITHPFRLIQKRYLRLITPYLVALTLAIGCAALARMWMNHASIPAAPNVFQMLAHIVLLHDLLNQEVLSAGIWYVAVDFQLYALMVLALWISHQIQTHHPSVQKVSFIFILSLTIISLFFFNRDSYWNETALYFFGSYGLGVLIYWTSVSPYRLLWVLMLIILIVLALAIDFRSRIAVAGSVMMILGMAKYFNVLESRYVPAFLSYLGRASYSIFQIHFPISLVVNAAFFRFLPHQPALHLIGLLVAIGASIGSGILLFKCFEVRPVTNRTRILLLSAFIGSGLSIMLGNL